MSRELSASSMSEVLPLVSSKALQSDINESQCPTDLCPTRALFSNNSVDQYLWLIKGSQLDVISVELKGVISQRLLGSFDFALIFNDNTIKITNVLQLMNGLDGTTANNKYIYTLIVSLKRSTGGCLLCLIDVRLSVVIKTIDCPFKITSLEVISSNRPNKTDTWPLIKEVLNMNGIIAIGTEGGLVFILDLFLDNFTPFTDALIPKKISFIVCNSVHFDVNAKRKTAVLHDQLICLPLNSDALHKNKFVYRTDDGKTISSFAGSQVFVSAIHYIPQTAMLCIGFNFGGFQLYNLKLFKLECSCGLEYDLPPVISFAFQDPENDPKNFSYMWVIRGQEIEDDSNSGLQSSPLYFNSITTAFMYSLCFESKEWIPDYGILYNGFLGCSCRFEYLLGANPHSPDLNLSCNSRLIDCYTIPLGNFSSHKSLDDESANLDLSLLFISWEALSESSDANSNTYFAIFDLNQWYRSQMPTTLHVSDDKLCSPFMGIFSLIDIANNFAPDAILSVKINRDSITKFRSQAFQDDLHYYPSSLSFQITILSESQMCNASYLGLQKRILSQMISRGPNILIDPKDCINNFKISGLLPYDLSQNFPSVSIQREIILTVAIENDCLPFLIQVIHNWSSGELTHIRCDSKFILEWIWKRVAYIKNAIDSITLPLFNYSGQLLDNLNLSQLYAYESDLKSLNILLKELQTGGAPTTKQGMQELSLRREVTQLVSTYLRILLWFHDCNLLPEHAEDEAYGENEVAYPTSKFKTYYSQRRSELHEINPSVIRPTDLLLIDGIVNSLNPGLSTIWKKGGGDGLYPPPNLHSLVGIFLLESVSLVQKQAVMLYSLLDLADYLSDRQSDIVEKIKLFPSAFNLKPGLIKMIQGMWGLDHKLFDFALQFLLDPIVKPILLGNKDNEMVVFNNLQHRIVTSFLYQNESKSALLYSRNCGQFSLDTAIREKLHLNMLLVNHQISRAFHYQRLCRTEANAYDILHHLFHCCEQMGVIEKIFKIPLDQIEEEVLTTYLLSSQSPNAKQMLVLYLIVNNKIIDAANVLNEFRNDFINIENKDLKEKTQQIMLLMSAYVSALPQSLTNLAKEIAVIEDRKLKDKPKTVVGQALPIKVKAKPLPIEWIPPSRAIEDVMEQIEEIWNKEKKPQFKPMSIHHKEVFSKVLLSQNCPFLRTPIAESGRLKKVKQSKNSVYLSPMLSDLDVDKVVKHKPKTTTEGSSRTRISLSATKQSSRLNSSNNELLSILETPQIKRKSPANRSKASIDIQLSSMASSYFTPTSILKVKQMMRRSTSPASSLASTPVSTSRLNSSKTLQSTPLQHKLRFSVPEKEMTFPDSEESVENARLSSIKDTFLLKLKPNSKANTDSDDSIEMEESDRLDLSTVIEMADEESKTATELPHISVTEEQEEDDEEEEEIETTSQYIFSPPKTRSSAKKAERNVKLSQIKPLESTYVFSPPNESNNPKTRTNSKKDKIANQPIEPKMEQPIEERMTSEPIIRDTPSRSPTPASYIDDSDSHKSDTSQKSKVSSRSSRSSRTPTKKSAKKVIETPTHSMKLRGSTTKSKTMDTPKKSDK